jgi:hypothetical protein
MDDKTKNDATDPDLISAYSRSEALADGLLVDVTETAREAGFLYPVALTRAAWELCVALSPPPPSGPATTSMDGSGMS